MNKPMIIKAMLTAITGAALLTGAPPAMAADPDFNKRYCDYPLVNPNLLELEDDCITVIPAGASYTS